MKTRSLRRRAGIVGVLGAASLVLVGCAPGGDPGGDPENPFGECEITDNAGTHEIDAVTEGVLTIAIPWPSGKAYDGETPEEVTGGYLYCLTAEIASRGGLNGVVINTTSFEALVTARTHDFDLSIWDVIVTAEREKVVDFATPYQSVQQGVAVRAEDAEVWTEDTIKDARIGYLVGSRAESLVADEIKPTQTTSTFQSEDDMYNALLARQIDVAMNDTTSLMPWAHLSGDKGAVVGQYRTDSDLAPVLPKGSPNTAIVSAILDDMNADGTTEAILARWQYPDLGGDPNDIPFWGAG